MKNHTEILSDGINFASRIHRSQKDKQGAAYILHPLHIMDRVLKTTGDLLVATVAVCHDSIEDSLDQEKAWSDFRSQVTDREDVIHSLKLLTHDHSQSYEDYIDSISTDTWATQVKLADITHNSDISRLKGVTDRDIARMAKYHRSYMRLKTGSWSK